MDTRDILNATQSAKRLIQIEEYYKHIFKKTERIVSVVFYITHSFKDSGEFKSHIDDIEHAARTVHDAVLQSLEARAHTAEDIVRQVAHSLITLESKLRIAQVAGLVAPAVLQVFVGEIDTVLRGISKYINADEPELTYAVSDEKPAAAPRKSVSASPYSEDLAPAAVAQKASRADRIKTVIEAKGQATIKDISDVITDVSEKTIQRELNVMIDKNIIKRQGERRWSKYSLF